MSNDMAFYVKELNSAECLCGRAKRPKRSFCYTCFKALPAVMKKPLYLFVGEGYEEAFDKAAAWLKEEVWI